MYGKVETAYTVCPSARAKVRMRKVRHGKQGMETAIATPTPTGTVRCACSSAEAESRVDDSHASVARAPPGDGCYMRQPVRREKSYDGNQLTGIGLVAVPGTDSSDRRRH